MNKENSDNKAPWWQPSLVLFGKLSGWIAGPVIAAIFLGKWLDKKYGTEPWLFLATVGIAFILSSIGIVRDSLREMKRIEEEEKNLKTK
jgi:F0F1-type ATP synthase assembly protein I